jgi:hypothetical protein
MSSTLIVQTPTNYLYIGNWFCELAKVIVFLLTKPKAFKNALIKHKKANIS